jgi:hypothetical protein
VLKLGGNPIQLAPAMHASMQPVFGFEIESAMVPCPIQNGQFGQLKQLNCTGEVFRALAMDFRTRQGLYA